MGDKRSFRVYFVPHARGLLTGTLIRQFDAFFDRPPPSAVGTSEDDVLRQLEVALQQALAVGDDDVERYLWEEDFQTRQVSLRVFPQSVSNKRMVIGAKEIPLRMSYAWCALRKGGYRVMLPRFGWWFVIESLDIAAEVLQSAVSSALLGEQASTLYDFRYVGDEYVRSWSMRGTGTTEDEAHDLDAARRFPVLSQVADEWVERAARNKLPGVVGESDAFTNALGLLSRSPPPSVLLVGPSGVGKTTFVRRLARSLLARRREGREAHTPRLWATSATRLIAGMTYVGMWQERCFDLLSELSHEGDYLYLDALVKLLQPQSDGASLGEILLPAARDGEVSVIAECTEAEYEHCRRRFASLVEPLVVLRLTPPPAYQLPVLLASYQQRKAPHLSLHAGAMKRLIHHLATFQRDVAFPGKAMRFVDWLAAGEGAPAPGQSVRAPKTLYPRDVSELFARNTGLPVELIADETRVGATALAARLSGAVIGQDHACAVAARVLARFKAGLDDPERPIGTLLFVGPTGVGKTELARTLARYMFGNEARMVRLDMSEYMFAGSAQRLLEVGSGVTSLAQRVREQPLSLVLLDEVEKAHPEVFDLLLGVLGEGRMTDSFGSVVDFRMTLVVMTSNLGVTETRPVGFDADATAAGLDRAVRQHFRPEFFNRIDHVVSFRNLSPDDVLRIVDLELSKAAQRSGLVRRNLSLRVTPALRLQLAEEGFHPTRGARPLKRVLEDRVVSPVAALLAREPALRDRGVTVGGDGVIDLGAAEGPRA
ncbi:MAG: ATP-dependent Clp protease ATP-binding subunit [Myxococcales bacterium]|nr:ATP-dependent Clp protease ATP-binding subunit [Myxococcales bacterium]